MQQRFTPAIAILLFVSSGLACSFLRPNKPLSWHILLEIDATAPERESAMTRTVSVIERRLDAVGINAKIEAQGPASNGRILVSLPEVPDRKRVTDLITGGGLLELTAVVSPPSPAPVQTYVTREEALASLGGTVPENRRVLPYLEGDESTTAEERSEAIRRGTRWVVVESPAIVGGAELRDAAAVASQGVDDSYNISFTLTPAGGKKFGDWTATHINQYLGVVLNGEVRSIAFIKSQITDQGEITGRFTKQSAEDLALILRSGALPAPVKVIEAGNNK